MSTTRGITIALDTFSASFNKSAEWAGRVERAWAAALEHVSDKNLLTAVNRLCSQVFEYPPTLGHLVAECKKVVSEQGGTGLSGNKFQFCPDCERYGGVVDVCAHFLKIQEDEYKVFKCATSCICDGARAKFGRSTLQTWADMKETMENDHRLRLDHFYRTSRSMPTLHSSITEPEFWSKVLLRMEEDAKNGIPNKYEMWAEAMINGTLPPNMFPATDDVVVGQKFIPPEQPTVRPYSNVVPPTPTPTQSTTTPRMSDADFWRDH